VCFLEWRGQERPVGRHVGHAEKNPLEKSRTPPPVAVRDLLRLPVGCAQLPPRPGGYSPGSQSLVEGSTAVGCREPVLLQRLRRRLPPPSRKLSSSSTPTDLFHPPSLPGRRPPPSRLAAISTGLPPVRRSSTVLLQSDSTAAPTISNLNLGNPRTLTPAAAAVDRQWIFRERSDHTRACDC
jgi:hypothetical protein